MFKAVVYHSLDRKVCNTLNTCCITKEADFGFSSRISGCTIRSCRSEGANAKLHITESADPFIPNAWRGTVSIERAEGEVAETQTEEIKIEDIGVEWEWENSPEVTLVVVASVAKAITLCNSYSPQFVASMVTEDDAEFEAFFDGINAPFVGNGFTRWVDGQYALNRPELGLSNWQYGRLFGRGGVLSEIQFYYSNTRVPRNFSDNALIVRTSQQ